MALTDKQQIFVAEYLQCFNATEAAIRAGYSEATARQQGSRLLSNVDIIGAIQAHKDERIASATEVLIRLTDMLRGDIGDVLDNHGNLDMLSARDSKKTRLIKRVKQKSFTSEEGDAYETEVELYSALDAAKLLAKYHRLIDRAKEEDWRTQAIADIRAGLISYDALAEAFDTSLAAQLFAAAGIAVQVGEGA